MRARLCFWCGIFSAAGLLAFALPTVEAKTIYVAVSNPDMSFLSGGVAKFQGYFKDEGLDVEVLQMNANVSVAALAAGNVDYNLILQSVVTANLRGLPLKIAGILIERPNHVVVAHPSVQKFADLKNKKIAISSFGSLVDILARLTAAHFQLDPRKDVDFVAAGSSSARVAQLQAGVVQAAFVTPPGNLRAEASGFKTLLRVRDLFPFPVNGIGVTEQKLKTNRDEVKKIVRALLRANRYIINNPKGAIKILSVWGRTKPEVAEDAYNDNAKNYSRNLFVSRRRWRTSSKARAGMSNRRTMSPSMRFLTSAWCARYLKKWGNRRVDGHEVEPTRANFYALLFLSGRCFCLLLRRPRCGRRRANEKIVFSIPSRSIAAIDLYIAKERGFFRDEGLDVDLVQIRGNVAMAAALSGQVQATNGVGTVIRAIGAERIAP